MHTAAPATADTHIYLAILCLSTDSWFKTAILLECNYIGEKDILSVVDARDFINGMVLVSTFLRRVHHILLN